jgi:7,8-dihydro-6-hydroxymethylpterin dimethyltransferase
MRLPGEVILSETGSVCPVCFAGLPAAVVASGQNVFMEKICPLHGEFRTLIRRGDPPYETWSGSKIPLSISESPKSYQRRLPV